MAIPGWTLMGAWRHSRGHEGTVTVGTTTEGSPFTQGMICDEVPGAQCALKKDKNEAFW